MQEKAII